MAEARVKIGEESGWRKLYTLRDVTERTGILHELQVKNLKMWPLVMIHAKDATCAFDYETRTVTYDIGSIDKPKPKNFQERLEALGKAVKQLLGDSYGIVVNLKGKKVFWSPPNE